MGIPSLGIALRLLTKFRIIKEEIEYGQSLNPAQISLFSCRIAPIKIPRFGFVADSEGVCPIYSMII